MSELNIEIKTSLYIHPFIKTGTHVEGLVNVFIQENNSSEWSLARDFHSVYKVKKKIEEVGLQKFLSTYCIIAKPPV